MANIRDVARLAGVSISSVSNVLNNRLNQVSSETLQRIEHAMSQLNYRSERKAVAAINNDQTRIMGLLVPSIVNPSFSALAHEVDLAARAYRYRVLLSNSYRQEREEALFVEDMFSHGVRGIIVAASDIRKTHFVRAAEKGMFIVSYDSQFSDNMASESQIDSVSMDNIAAGQLATQHLIERGCQNIVFATESTLTIGRNQKIEGFLTALRQHSMQHRVIECKASNEYGDTEMYELGLAMARDILTLTPRPDGIVAINDALGIGLIMGFRAAGVNVPESISVVGIDNISISSFIEPGLTSVMPPLAEMANIMVERLVSRINNEIPESKELLLSPTLVERGSVISKK
jgi:DNA-binding LacI/PurR family transcriptional regulator